MGRYFCLRVSYIYFPVLVLFKIILRLCSANKYLITNNITNANIQCKFLELIRYIYISYHVEPLNIQNALILFFTFDKIRQRRILKKIYENMYALCVYLHLQTKCQSYNSYLLEINSEAEQNW